MKVALLGPYPPPYGGISTSVKQLAYHLNKDGYNVVVVATSVAPVDCSDPNLDVRYLTLFDRLRFLRQWQPDIIHSHSNRWPSLKTTVAALVLQIPFIHTIHGELTPKAFIGMNPMRRLLAKWSMFRTDITNAVSKPLVDFLLSVDIPQHKIRMIPSLLPLESDIYTSMKDGVDTINKILITTTGFYERTYGFELIPEVAVRLTEHSIDYTWVIVGYGNEAEIGRLQNELEKANVKERVLLVGELDRLEMLDLLDKSHIYVRTKYSDSFGIVIAEAHQLGCHCLFGDNNPYFKEGPRLTRYRTGDTDSLTDNLLKIIAQVSLEKPQHVDSPFATEAKLNYEAIKRIYEEVVVRP